MKIRGYTPLKGGVADFVGDMRGILVYTSGDFHGIAWNRKVLAELIQLDRFVVFIEVT
jgi:hypothetical protein